MATRVQDLIPMLNREVNATGVELFPTMSAGTKIGYLKDGFWDARLAGMLDSYTVALGEDITPAQTTGTYYYTNVGLTNDDLPDEYHMLITLFAGFRLIRLKILNLAVNFKAVAGPAEYEQQASATTLRAVLASLEKRLQELKAQYSEDFNQSAFIMMDGIAQSTYSLLQGLPDMQIVY